LADRYLMSVKQSIDYLFIGLGASNCLLILELEKKALLSQKKIIIIEPHQKNKKDKTYCFWATDEDAHNIIEPQCIDKSWSTVILNGKKQDLDPLSYYHVSSLTLYQKTLSVIDKHDATILQNKISDTEPLKTLIIDNSEYNAKYIFDCRPPKTAPTKKHEYYINQSFVGWQIETKEELFDSHSFTMMDFNIPQDGATQFVYVLPFNSKKALVEVTRFGTDIMQREEGEALLKNYISQLGDGYQITDIEIGCIPMTNTSFLDENDSTIRNMGARAGHVKPSTGYAFRSMAMDAQKIAEQIAEDQKVIPASINQKRNNRFAFYDRLLLHILFRTPKWGKPIFKRLFDAIKATEILAFLDEETKLKDEVKIFYALQWKPFIKAVIYDAFSIDRIKNSILVPLFITLIFLVFDGLGIGHVNDVILLAGLVFIGIPHGAVDHLIEHNRFNEPIRISFIIRYLAQAALVVLLWYLSPALALFFFVGYSVYHFAQADFSEWGVKVTSVWLWGTLLFTGLLLGHPLELSGVLNELTLPSLAVSQGILLKSVWVEIAVIALCTSLVLGITKHVWGMCIVSISLLLALQLSLIQAFGIYFIFQHSRLGWRHIQKHFNVSSKVLWRKSALFSLGAYGLFFLLWCFLNDNWDSYLGTFFIFLSAISFPHVIRMKKFYGYFKREK
jgi:lycopene beta-cyclase